MADLDPAIQKKVEEQQRILEEQRKDEELLLLQQAAIMEKQREEQELLLQQQQAQRKLMEEQEKEQQLFQLQQVALRTKQMEEYERHTIREPPAPIPAPPRMAPPGGFHAVPPSLSAPPQIVASRPPPPPPRLPPAPIAPVMPARPAPPMNLPPAPAPPPLRVPGLAGPPGAPGDDDSGADTEPPPQPPPAVVKAQQEAREKEIKIPQALEQALAFKTERAKQVGIAEEDIDKLEKEGVPQIAAPPVKPQSQHKLYLDVEEEEEEDEDEEKHKKKDSKRKKKKKKKKSVTQRKLEMKMAQEDRQKLSEAMEKADIEVEYIQEKLEIEPSHPMFRHFIKIFETFKIAETVDSKEESKLELSISDPKKEPAKEVFLKKVPKGAMEDDDDKEEENQEDDKSSKMSKRKMKQMLRMSVAELKQAVVRPDVVEMHDVTAKDPRLLVLLKSTRNTVPVPRHWCFKRKYLQGKRGIEKPPFQLPDFIRKTGIMEMRQALADKEEQRTLKAKMRERVRPKLGKIDIDYQKLHDAFFKWQTKPRMTIHGDLYYEGKEFETRLKEKKPGELSEELRTALGMPVGANSNKVPPPWLIAMQRYGPPPSYPHLKIPGLSAPIPDGCSFGYHAGGWGKPPVDEQGKPLYGDVFGNRDADMQPHPMDEEVDHSMWGELESESEESEVDESEEEGDDGEEADIEGLQTPMGGVATPSGISSIPAGMETPDIIELRKKKIETEMEGGDTPALYTILPEKRVDQGLTKAMMGSTHTYDFSGAQKGGTAPVAAGAEEGGRGGGVELALDPSELDLVNTDAMAARYEQTLREQSQLQKEDLSDMVADHAARQKRKRGKQQQQESGSKPKKYKEFKF